MSTSHNRKVDFGNAIHGRALSAKQEATNDVDLGRVLQKYLIFRTQAEKLKVIDENSVFKLVSLLNGYRNDVLTILESRKNSGQENLRSSILEEFLYLLFKDLIRNSFKKLPENLIIGKADSYIDLTFSPRSFISLFENPSPYIHKKFQDFVLGASIVIEVKSSEEENSLSFKESNIVIPVITIECKTYIESNMLDSCAGTAKRLKSAMPYCSYIVAAEYMKMGKVEPELTDIDEVYVFCKATNSERLKKSKEGKAPHRLDKKLVYDLFLRVEEHLRKIWWSPEDAVRRGKIIGR